MCDAPDPKQVLLEQWLTAAALADMVMATMKAHGGDDSMVKRVVRSTVQHMREEAEEYMRRLIAELKP